MDNKTTINDLKEIVKNFCDERDWEQFHNPKDLAICISTEAAELLELFRFKNQNEVKEMFNGEKKVKICDEIADVLYCILRFAEMNDIDLSTELRRKMVYNKLKYSIENAKGNNNKYDEYDS